MSQTISYQPSQTSSKQQTDEAAVASATQFSAFKAAVVDLLICSLPLLLSLPILMGLNKTGQQLDSYLAQALFFYLLIVAVLTHLLHCYSQILIGSLPVGYRQQRLQLLHKELPASRARLSARTLIAPLFVVGVLLSGFIALLLIWPACSLLSGRSIADWIASTKLVKCPSSKQLLLEQINLEADE